MDEVVTGMLDLAVSYEALGDPASAQRVYSQILAVAPAHQKLAK